MSNEKNVENFRHLCYETNNLTRGHFTDDKMKALIPYLIKLAEYQFYLSGTHQQLCHVVLIEVKGRKQTVSDTIDILKSLQSSKQQFNDKNITIIVPCFFNEPYYKFKQNTVGWTKKEVYFSAGYDYYTDYCQILRDIAIEKRFVALEGKLDRIVSMLEYAPNGPGYQKAKEEFETLNSSHDPSRKS